MFETFTYDLPTVLPADARAHWAFMETNSAAAVIQAVCANEWSDIVAVLSSYRLNPSSWLRAGGNRGDIAEEIDGEFIKRGWQEARLDLETKGVLYLAGGEKLTELSPVRQQGYLVDNFKNRIVLDVEWNAKDGNLDRDLASYRSWFEAGVISAGVIITKDRLALLDLARRLWSDYQATLPESDQSRRLPIDLATSTTTSFDKAQMRVRRGVRVHARCLLSARTRQPGTVSRSVRARNSDSINIERVRRNWVTCLLTPSGHRQCAPIIARLDDSATVALRPRLREHTVNDVCSVWGSDRSQIEEFAGDQGPMLSETGICAAADLARFARGRKYRTILADPPWRFENRTGKMAPEHRRLSRYETMTLDDICALPVEGVAADPAHLYLWCPNALLPEGLRVMQAWGFSYKSNIVWHKVRKDGGSDGRGVGFYFRNVTELLLFGVRGKNARTLGPGRSQVNMIETRKREHSRKPDEQYAVIEACSPGPRLELFARGKRDGWTPWGNQADESYRPTWATYAYTSVAAE